MDFEVETGVPVGETEDEEVTRTSDTRDGDGRAPETVGPRTTSSNGIDGEKTYTMDQRRMTLQTKPPPVFWSCNIDQRSYSVSLNDQDKTF